MLFNSFEYIVFLIAVFILFVLTNRTVTLRLRNVILLAASWYFYSCLHWWFVLLLLYTTTVNYLCGRWIASRQSHGGTGKQGVAVSVILSLAILIVFKYAYIFDSSIMLPVGLSFFTFQALIYTVDIYRKKIPVENDPVNVALFISFFPTLLSGPIERARNMLPQLRERTPVCWDNITSGAGFFIWGLFKKVVIADRLAEYVNLAYLNPEAQSGSTLALAAVFYSFQIYCDFSGYADMAVASGRILGFKIMQNFNFPYCVNTIKEFWRRWHISLTSWFTEYVYISMGGNRVTKLRWMLNIATVFLLSGIWHGATWSFVLWGALHAAYYFMEYYLGPKKPNFLYHIFVFILITLAWIFFRIEDIGSAWFVVSKIFTDFISPISGGSSMFSTLLTILLLLLFLVREYLMYKNILPQKHPVEYIILILCICLLGVSSEQFVYFQF